MIYYRYLLDWPQKCQGRIRNPDPPGSINNWSPRSGSRSVIRITDTGSGRKFYGSTTLLLMTINFANFTK